MKKALVLSGGGARCIAQLGFAARLEEKGVSFDTFSGSSAGSLAAALLAKGMRAKEAFEFLKKIDYKKVIGWNLFKGSIFHLKKAENILKNELGFKDFCSLEKKLFVCVTEYESGESFYVSEGDLPLYVIASCSLLPIFPPFEVEGKFFIDGGFTDNLPVTPCVGDHKILAVNVNPPIKTKKSFIGNVYKGCFTMFNANVRHSKTKADYFVEMKKCGYFSIFDTENFDELFRIGYEEGEKFLKMHEDFF